MKVEGEKRKEEGARSKDQGPRSKDPDLILILVQIFLTCASWL